MSKVIGVKTDYNGTEWHAVNAVAGADYHTLCGLDADDPRIGHFGTVQAPRGQKITCSQCHAVWRGVTDLNLRAASFDVSGSSIEE